MQAELSVLPECLLVVDVGDFDDFELLNGSGGRLATVAV